VVEDSGQPVPASITELSPAAPAPLSATPPPRRRAV
jgi:hypothetical protein